MSHFVSTGANFDDLNAQLLQRRAETGDQEEAETSEQTGEEYDDEETNDGTIKGRPTSTASTLDPEEGAMRGDRSAGSTPRRPIARHAASSNSTPYLSRKNSEEDLTTTPTSSGKVGGRARKSTDHDARLSRLSALQRESDSASSSRATSPAHRQPHKSSKEVAFTDPADRADSSSVSGSEGLQRTNSGMVHSPRSHHHRFANSDQADGSPHHILSAGHHARLKESINASEVTPPKKLGTWDGVFMPVSLNVSDTLNKQEKDMY